MIRVTVFVALIALCVVLGVNRASRADSPAPVSAQCNDGSLSRSATRSGTCAHHGGVMRWIKW